MTKNIQNEDSGVVDKSLITMFAKKIDRGTIAG